jgi:hypothetical protein
MRGAGNKKRLPRLLTRRGFATQPGWELPVWRGVGKLMPRHPEGTGVEMWRSTQELVQMREWVESRAGWPCRRIDGRITFNFPGERCGGLEIGWAEFEINFLAGRMAFAYEDEEPGRWLLGTWAEARDFAARLRAAAGVGRR